MTLARDYRFRNAVANLRTCADALSAAPDQRQFASALSDREQAALRKLIGLCEAFASAYATVIEQERING